MYSFSQQRSRFSYKNISPAFASSHGFATNTDMAEFLCVLTDLTSLHFMVLFCLDSLRSGSAVTAEHSTTAWDRKSYETERECDSPMLQDEEGNDRGDKEEDERLDLNSDGFTQGDWCRELSSSCRLQLLPFHINYSPELGYPGSDSEGHPKQGESLPPSSKSLASISGQSVWVEVDSIKEGAERMPFNVKSSERERMCEGNEKESIRERESKSDTDNGACEYIQQYGSYLNLDLVAACCSLRELPLALDCTLLVSGADQQLDTLSSSLGAMPTSSFAQTLLLIVRSVLQLPLYALMKVLKLRLLSHFYIICKYHPDTRSHAQNNGFDDHDT
jgi:hypothetical protein